MLMTVTAGLVIGYWVEWFTKGRVKSSNDLSYITFEESFPLADGYMAALYLLSARALWKQREVAVLLGIAAGSAHAFLALLDLLFDLKRGNLRATNPEMQVEKAIVASSLIFAPLTIVRLWRARRRLAG